MILSDTIIENNSLILENIISNASSDWSAPSSGYALYTMYYSKPVLKDHVYYGRFTYKFTTTNQSPTWCRMYFQGGMTATTASISNPVAGTEYTVGGYATMTSGPSYPLASGQIYNGASSAIKGVSSCVKNVMLYDVTQLYTILKATGTVTSYNELVAWCDSNLTWKAPNSLYDISSLVDDLTNVSINAGSLCGEIVECDGMEYYSVSDALRNNTYFDSGIGISVYNNNNNGAVVFERVSAKDVDSPFYPEHKYVLKITTNGTAAPSCGGFVATHTAAANKIMIEKFVAKVPVGYTVTAAYNSQGTGNRVSYLTDRAGTGNWEEYAILYQCGSEGTFSTGGHVYLLPDASHSATSVTWYVAYANNCDVTSDESLKNYTVLPNKDIVKGNKIYSKYFDTVNLLPNGDGSNTAVALPSGWTWDTNDVAGNAKASIVQPVGASSGYLDLFGKLKVNPHMRYRISMWIKGKQDMTSFLTAIRIFAGTNGEKELTHAWVNYVNGTKTKLTEDLVSGAMSMKVASNANWIDRSYSRIGFRTSQYNSSYNDYGMSNSNGSTGLISGISGADTVNFKVAYSGNTIPAGTFVVESYDGGTYPYPINKSSLPTDNTWKYVEGYFGTENSTWDGAGGNWTALPTGATYISLYMNIYTNDSSVPIKYADIRIEEIGAADGERHENKIQFKKID